MKIARAAPVPVAGRFAGTTGGRERSLPRLYHLPQVLIDDA